MFDILKEAGFNIQINETLVVYAIAIIVIILTIIALVTRTNEVKAILKATAEAILAEHKLTDEKLSAMYDNLIVKVKTVLKKPNASGKIPFVNKLLVVFLSIPITKKLVIGQVRTFLNELEGKEEMEKALEALKAQDMAEKEEK